MSQKTILIAPNSFKECVDSVTISNIIYSELSKLPDLNLIKKPISDGGDGFLSVCNSNFNLRLLSYYISTPYDNEKFLCEVGYDESNKTIYIESANVLGMKIVPKEKRHPLNLSSKGMGDLLISIYEDLIKGIVEVNKIAIGIGGTCTNDLGMGMISRLGLELNDLDFNPINVIPANFQNVRSIKPNILKLPFEIELIVDVDNPLMGNNGATMIFGKQKGSTQEELKFMEYGFGKLVNLFISNKLLDSFKFLSGAGGGLAAGFQIFLNADVIQSNQFISEELGFKDLSNIDLIITGEGSFDEQSMMKKATGSIIEMFESKKLPVLLVCGKADKNIKNKLPEFVTVFELVDLFGNEEGAIKNFEEGLYTACDLARKIINA